MTSRPPERSLDGTRKTARASHATRPRRLGPERVQVPVFPLLRAEGGLLRQVVAAQRHRARELTRAEGRRPLGAPSRRRWYWTAVQLDFESHGLSILDSLIVVGSGCASLPRRSHDQDRACGM